MVWNIKVAEVFSSFFHRFCFYGSIYTNGMKQVPKHWWTSYDYFLDIAGYHDNTKALQHPYYLLIEVDVLTILGEPGAASRDDALFSGESFLQEWKSEKREWVLTCLRENF